MKCVIGARNQDARKIEVHLDAQEVDDLLRNCHIAVAQRAGLSPEKSKTARAVAEESLGAEEVAHQVTEMVVKRAAPLVLDEAGVDAVGYPSFGCYGYAEQGQPFAFDMTVTAKPRIELDSYDPVEIPAMEASVDEAELDAFMENVARFHPDAIVDKQARVVALDGVVRLSMETTRDGKRYEPLCFDEKEYRLGKSDMPEGFDEQLAGMEAGQTKTISFVAPDPTQPRGGASRQCAYFAQVTVTAIMKLVDPVIDDAWVASNIEGCATVQAMRDKAAKELEEGKASQIGEYERYCAADAVSKRLSQPIPDAVFSAAYEKALDEHASMLEYQGITLEDYLQNAEMDEREFKHRLMSQVRERLRQEVALDAVARHEGLKVSKDDLREYLDRLTDGQHEQTLKSLGEHGGMHAAREGALREKANRLLVERAVRSAG